MKHKAGKIWCLQSTYKSQAVHPPNTQTMRSFKQYYTLVISFNKAAKRRCLKAVASSGTQNLTALVNHLAFPRLVAPVTAKDGPQIRARRPAGGKMRSMKLNW